MLRIAANLKYANMAPSHEHMPSVNKPKAFHRPTLTHLT